MHIHQVHFLAFATNHTPMRNPLSLDNVNVPVDGSVDVVMDFTNPVIKGMSVFHCHFLNHQDKGMMAKILFEGARFERIDLLHQHVYQIITDCPLLGHSLASN